MNEQNEVEIATGLPNGAAHDYPKDVPVMDTEPAPKKRRKRKASPKPRQPKVRAIDPLRAETEQASAATTTQPSATGSLAETPSVPAQEGSADGASFETERRRQSSLKRMFSDNAPRPERHPPLKSSFPQRFFARTRVAADGVLVVGPSHDDRLFLYLFAALAIAFIGTGLVLAVF